MAVSSLNALDSAVHLLSDSQLNRLLPLLEYLDAKDGFFFTPAATARLAELPACDFSFLVTRQIAIVVGERYASVEERATWWQLGFCGDAKRGQVRIRSGDPVPATKPYRGLLIDRDLDEAQMDRLNAVAGVTITSTCAGHPEHASAPGFAFRTVAGRSGYVESEIVNTGTNQDELRVWWDTAIDQIETDVGHGRGRR